MQRDKKSFSECLENSILNKTGTIHILRQQKNWVGGLKDKLFWWRRVLYLCWHSVWVIKGPKMCGHNKWMVPSVKQNSQSWNHNWYQQTPFVLFSDKEFWFVDSFLILGIMVVICAVMFGAFTIETCISLRKAIARVQDKEIDKISNLHLVKHWIEPGN